MFMCLVKFYFVCVCMSVFCVCIQCAGAQLWRPKEDIGTLLYPLCLVFLRQTGSFTKPQANGFG